MRSRCAVAGLSLALALTGSATAAQEDAERDTPFGDALTTAGVDEVLLDTTFGFAVEFNRRPAERRRGARIVGVAESFFRNLAPRIYPVHGPRSRERARARLRGGVGEFLEGYVALLIEQGVRDIELRQSETIDVYLSLAAGGRRCNQIPCPPHPCCTDCSAPTGTPPRCPP